MGEIWGRYGGLNLLDRADVVQPVRLGDEVEDAEEQLAYGRVSDMSRDLSLGHV